jgi:hypothetical protein
LWCIRPNRSFRCLALFPPGECFPLVSTLTGSDAPLRFGIHRWRLKMSSRGPSREARGGSKFDERTLALAGALAPKRLCLSLSITSEANLFLKPENKFVRKKNTLLELLTFTLRCSPRGRGSAKAKPHTYSENAT